MVESCSFHSSLSLHSRVRVDDYFWFEFIFAKQHPSPRGRRLGAMNFSSISPILRTPMVRVLIFTSYDFSGLTWR